MFLSIIIPVYNAEAYLAECLDSCLDQCFPSGDYEILCVNDGSSDGSAEILARYAGENPRIRVITQPNSGVSVARNTGVDAAGGEYIWFVDADDFIRRNCLEQLFRTLSDAPVDKLSFGHFEFEKTLSEAQSEQAARGSLRPTRMFLGGMIWESLYRRAFLVQHGLRFREGISYAEDGLFLYELSQCKPTVSSVDQVFYHYRRNPSSVTRRRSDAARKKRSDSALQVALVMIEYARKHNRELQNCPIRQRAAVLMPEVRTILISAAQLPEEHRRQICAALRSCGLYPLFLYRWPRDWFPKRIHMSHAHMGLKGNVLDILNFYATTRWGFALLVLYYKLRQRR